jgi:phosphoenolpyruvate carboxykinase (ATP)
MLEQGVRNPEFGAEKFGFRDLQALNWNLLEPELYECAIKSGEAKLTSGGALCAETGVHTGRSPKDKYIVCDDLTNETVWWENNGKMTPAQFALLHQDPSRILPVRLFTPKTFVPARTRRLD